MVTGLCVECHVATVIPQTSIAPREEFHQMGDLFHRLGHEAIEHALWQSSVEELHVVRAMSLNKSSV